MIESTVAFYTYHTNNYHECSGDQAEHFDVQNCTHFLDSIADCRISSIHCIKSIVSITTIILIVILTILLIQWMVYSIYHP